MSRQRALPALVPATATRRRGLRALLLTAVAFGVAAPGAQADVVKAQPATNFRNSVGVQMHHPFTGYAYDKDSPIVLGNMLKTLGIWHVRDAACFNLDEYCSRTVSRMVALRDSLGAGQPKVDYLLGLTRELQGHTDRAARDADIESALTSLAATSLTPLVAGLEQINEPDLQGTADWAKIATAEDATVRRLLAQPRFAALRKLPLLTPPLGRSEATSELLAAGWNGSEQATPNFHPYPPAWSGPEIAMDRPCVNVPTKAATLVTVPALTQLQCAQQLATGAAPVATESGYSTANNPQSTSWVSEQAQAMYLPRLLLDNFSRGIARTYLYELIDLSPDYMSTTNGYGLWRARLTSTGVGSAGAKGVVNVLSRLNERIGDAGAKPLSGVLDLTLRNKLTGAVLPESAVRRVLLRRKDGSYALALWQPKSVFDNTYLKQHSIAVPDVSVDLAINSRTLGAWVATAFRPYVDEKAQRWSPAKRITVPVGADVTLIDLRSSWSGGPIPGGPVALRP